MIDPRVLKEKPDLIKEMLKKRNIEYPIDELFELDKNRRNLLIELQNIKHKKNILSKEIAIKKKNIKSTIEQKQATLQEIKEMEHVGKQITILETKVKENEEKYLRMIRSIPNFFHDSVPIGKDEKDNKIVRTFRDVRKYEHDHIKSTTDKRIETNEFLPNNEMNKLKIKSHMDIADNLDLIDLERAGKISGSRFYFLKNGLVKLGMALSNFAVDYLIKEGYTIVQPPYMIKKEAMEGAIILSDFEETIYKIENEDLYMIGTSEHALASMHMNEIMEGKKLPLRYASISPCFRKEAGAHGKDMKGIFRVHQFEKVEQFIFCKPEESWNEHEKLLNVTEKFFELLDLPFRTISLCSGDLGKVSAKTYDIEAWFPAQNAYREICSCSNCTDYQARGLKIRYRDNPNEETRHVHTLNSTLVAIQRTMVSIIENYQTRNGKVEIPTVLRSYMNDMKVI